MAQVSARSIPNKAFVLNGIIVGCVFLPFWLQKIKDGRTNPFYRSPSPNISFLIEFSHFLLSILNLPRSVT